MSQWIKALITTLIITGLGGAIKDRLALGERFGKVEQSVEDTDKHLSQIDQKLDRLMEERHK